MKTTTILEFGWEMNFSIQKFILQIFAIINGSSVMYSEKKPQHDFQRPFGIFPNIHPFWWGHRSLTLNLRASRSTDGCRVDPWYPRKEEIGASLAIFRPILTDGNHEKNSHSYGLKMVGIA